MNNGKWSWSDYLIKRVTRLWIVLIPCLILTYIIGNIQVSIFGYHKLVESLNWQTFVGNIFFLQKILVDPYGMNGPLWSLSYEFCYYLLFPCLILTIHSKTVGKKAFYLTLFISIALFVGPHIMLYFLVWMLGAIIPFIKLLNLQDKKIQSVITLFSLALLFISMNYPATMATFLKDIKVGITSALFVYIIISFYNQESSNLKTNIPKHLAGFSFTLYLAHYPLANLILTWLVSPLWPFSKTTLLVKVVLALSVLTYSWFLAMITERHTEVLRKSIQKVILKQQNSSDTKQVEI
nr:acyltransferase family protein [Bacillus sp. Y1]